MADRLAIGGLEDPDFGDDSGDELRWRHIERGVEDLSPAGGGGGSGPAHHLIAMAIFHGDLSPAGHGGIDGGLRGRHIERNIVVLALDG